MAETFGDHYSIEQTFVIVNLLSTLAQNNVNSILTSTCKPKLILDLMDDPGLEIRKLGRCENLAQI